MSYTPKIRKTIFIVDKNRKYTFDINEDIKLHTLKKMLISAANLGKISLRIFHKGKEYTNYNNETIESLFPNLNEIEFTIQINYNKIDDLDSLIKLKLNTNYCPFHNFKYPYFYCFTCKKSICSNCILSNKHKNHNYKEKYDYLQNSKLLVEQLFNDLKVDYGEINSDFIKTLIEKIQNKNFPILIQLIQTIEKKLIDLINNFIHKEKGNIKLIENNIENLKKNCVDGLDELKEQISIEDMMLDEEIFLIFDKKFKDISNEKNRIQNDFSKYKILQNQINMIKDTIDKIYNDIYNFLIKYVNNDVYVNINNEIEDCNVNTIGRKEIFHKLLSDIKKKPKIYRLAQNNKNQVNYNDNIEIIDEKESEENSFGENHHNYNLNEGNNLNNNFGNNKNNVNNFLKTVKFNVIKEKNVDNNYVDKNYNVNNNVNVFDNNFKNTNDNFNDQKNNESKNININTTRTVINKQNLNDFNNQNNQTPYQKNDLSNPNFSFEGNIVLNQNKRNDDFENPKIKEEISNSNQNNNYTNNNINKNIFEQNSSTKKYTINANVNPNEPNTLVFKLNNNNEHLNTNYHNNFNNNNFPNQNTNILYSSNRTNLIPNQQLTFNQNINNEINRNIHPQIKTTTYTTTTYTTNNNNIDLSKFPSPIFNPINPNVNEPQNIISNTIITENISNNNNQPTIHFNTTKITTNQQNNSNINNPNLNLTNQNNNNNKSNNKINNKYNIKSQTINISNKKNKHNNNNTSSDEETISQNSNENNEYTTAHTRSGAIYRNGHHKNYDTYICQPIVNSNEILIYTSHKEIINKIEIKFPNFIYEKFPEKISWFNKDNYLYITGGIINGKISKIFLKYDPMKNHFERLLDLPEEKINHTMIYDNHNNLYLIGGNTNSILKYNLDNQKWIKLNLKLNYLRNNPMCFIKENYLYVFWGKNDLNYYVTSIEKGDLNSKNEFMDIINKDYIHLINSTIIQSDKDNLFFFGGKNENGIIKTVMRYNFNNNYLETTPFNLKEGSIFHQCILPRLNKDTFGNFGLDIGMSFVKININ